jgi:hypothetical protein
MKLNLEESQPGDVINVTNNGGIAAYYTVDFRNGTRIRFVVQPGGTFQITRGDNLFDIDIDLISTAGPTNLG